MKLRIALLGAILIVSASASAQDLSRLVSFSAPAARASELLPQLFDATGIKMLTNNQMGKEVLLIHVNQVPLRDLLDNIAKVTNGIWKRDRRRYVLLRMMNAVNKAAAKEHQQRASLVRAALESVQERAKALGPWSAAEAAELSKAYSDMVSSRSNGARPTRETARASQTIRSRAPATRFIGALLGAIGADDLADIRQGQRIVYATHPTAMQRPMPQAADEIISEFAEAQRAYASEYAKLGIPPSQRSGGFRFDGAPSFGDGNMSLGLGQTLLVIDSPSQLRETRLSANLIVADKAGATIASGTSFLSLGLPQEVGGPEAGGHVIELSAAGQELASAIQKMGRSNAQPLAGRVVLYVSTPTGRARFMSAPAPEDQPPTPSTALRDKLLNPEKFEPQSLILGDALTAAAKELSLNLVADLPDSSFQSVGRAFGGRTKVTAEELLHGICPSAGMDVAQSAGWALVSPQKPVQTTDLAVDRPGLGKFLRAHASGSLLKLDELCALALSQSKAVDPSDLDGILIRLCDPKIADMALESLQNPNPLRILGTFTPAEHSAMESDATIPLSLFTPDQQGWLMDDVFNSFDGPEIAEPQPAPSQPPVRGRIDPMMPGILQERTQLLPNGISPTGTLHIGTKTSKALIGSNPRGGPSAYLTALDLAGEAYQREHPQFGTPPSYDTFQVAQRTELTFKYSFTDFVGLTRSLEDINVEPASTPLAYNQLPDAIKKSIEEALDEMRTQLGRIRIHTGAQTTPPP